MSSSSLPDAKAVTPVRPARPRFWFYLLAVALGLLNLCQFITLLILKDSTRRSAAYIDLRGIGQASVIYASLHQGRLPQAADVWGYAAQLARDGDLNDASIWTAGTDPANETELSDLGRVLVADGSSPTPEFLKLKPSWAVPLGELTVNLPSTTPVAWTRGLRPDGTWAPYGPYGTDGGYVMFLGGNVAFYRNTRDAFLRFDGKGTTYNVLEALPPGTRIGEYVPNEAEQRTWQIRAKVRPLICPLLWLGTFLVLTMQAIRRKWPSSLVLWFLLVSLLVTPVLDR